LRQKKASPKEPSWEGKGDHNEEACVTRKVKGLSMPRDSVSSKSSKKLSHEKTKKKKRVEGTDVGAPLTKKNRGGPFANPEEKGGLGLKIRSYDGSSWGGGGDSSKRNRACLLQGRKSACVGLVKAGGVIHVRKTGRSGQGGPKVGDSKLSGGSDLPTWGHRVLRKNRSRGEKSHRKGNRALCTGGRGRS